MKLFRLSLILLIPLLAGCAELQELRRIKQMQESRIQELEKQNSEYKKAYFDLKEDREAERISLLREIETLKKRLEEIQDSRTETLEQLKTDNRALRNRLQSATTDLNKTRAELMDLKEQESEKMTELENANSQLRETLNKKEAQIDGFSLEKSRMTSRIEELQKEIGNLENIVSLRDKKITDLNKEIASSKSTITKLTESRNSLENQLKEAEVGSEEYNKLKADLETTRASLEEKAEAMMLDPKLKEAEKRFRESFTSEIEADKLRLYSDERGMVINIYSDDLFESGSVILTEDIKPLLQKIATLLQKYPEHPVNIEGHTDTVPIENLPFLDNLALSSARADNVVRYLTEAGGLDKERFKSIACSWFHPIATNKTPDGRKKNRRVEIILGPR